MTFELEPSEVDCGHITMFRVGDDWRCFFNFLRGRSRADALAGRANSFLQAAKTAHDSGSYDVAVDTLFSACELLAKANLIVHMLNGSESRTHKPIHSAINYWGKLGNVEPEFVKIFNKLSNLRHLARYEVSDLSELRLPAEDFEIVAAQVATVHDLCKHRVSAEERKPVRITAIVAGSNSGPIPSASSP